MTLEEEQQKNTTTCIGCNGVKVVDDNANINKVNEILNDNMEFNKTHTREEILEARQAVKDSSEI